MDRENVRMLIRQSVSDEKERLDPPVLQSLKQASMRVACYSRCAIDDIGQVSSAELIARSAERYIRSVPSWSFAGTYTDQCKNSMPLERRGAFQQLKQRAGDYDLILCRSVSRLGTALPDILREIQWFRKNGIGIYFESEDLYTLDSHFPQTLEMMKLLAEEESVQKSRALITPIQWRTGQNGKMPINSDGKGDGTAL